MLDQVLGEQGLALLGAVVGEQLASFGQGDVGALEFGKAQMLEHLRDREQVVHFQQAPLGHSGQAGVTVVGLGGQGFDQAGHQVGGHFRQQAAHFQFGYASAGIGAAAVGHQGVNVIDHLPEGRVQPIARVRERHLDFCHHPTGVR